MSSPALEAFLAHLYTDDDARARFLADMRGAALNSGLTDAEAAALEKIDRVGLQMAAASYAQKRAQHGQKGAQHGQKGAQHGQKGAQHGQKGAAWADAPQPCAGDARVAQA